MVLGRLGGRELIGRRLRSEVLGVLWSVELGSASLFGLEGLRDGWVDIGNGCLGV